MKVEVRIRFVDNNWLCKLVLVYVLLNKAALHLVALLQGVVSLSH